MSFNFLTLTGDPMHDINAIAWVITNLLIVYIAAMVLIFVTGYYILFNPKATTAGRYVFRFFVSLLVLTLLLFITLFIDPGGDRIWSEYPTDVMVWRPLTRLAGYIYVAYSITSLAWLLFVRKWCPNKLVTTDSYNTEFTSETRKENHDKHTI